MVVILCQVSHILSHEFISNSDNFSLPQCLHVFYQNIQVLRCDFCLHLFAGSSIFNATKPKSIRFKRQYQHSFILLFPCLYPVKKIVGIFSAKRQFLAIATKNRLLTISYKLLTLKWTYCIL